MAHPQSSPRGYFAKQRVDVGSQAFTANSTGISVSGALFISGQTTGGKLTANSTGITAAGKLTAVSTIVASNQATFGLLSANSTAMILPNSVRIGALASYISANSTGIKIGARYISTNTTGNTTT